MDYIRKRFPTLERRVLGKLGSKPQSTATGAAAPSPPETAAGGVMGGSSNVSFGSDGALEDAPSNSGIAAAADTSRHGLIEDVVSAPVADLDGLRGACWFGCPPRHRRAAWSLLTDYWPTTAASRDTVAKRRRAEYQGYLQRHYSPFDWGAVLEEASSPQYNPSAVAEVGTEELQTIRQVRKDVPRTANGVPLIAHAAVQALLERVLFVWAIRHPASGYVQGMNDLVLPFLYVVMADELPDAERGQVEALLAMDTAQADAYVAGLGDEGIACVEADVYWLASAFISAVQDNFTVNQTGAHAMVAKLEAVLRVTDPALTLKLEEFGIRFPEFAFRWMNCLLLRELSTLQGIRLWDAYLCDLNDFAEMHIYVCAALLRLWAGTITRSNDFVSVMHFLQALPTRDITPRGMDELFASAFLLHQLYRPTLGGLSQADGLGSRGSDTTRP